MSLITAQKVKDNFPQWEHYAEFDTEAADAAAALTKQIENAETELADYTTVTEDTIDAKLERHLLNIVKKNLFDLQHIDTEFERDPGIVADYKQTIRMLEQLRDGERPGTPESPDDAAGAIHITAKKRRFGPGNWFRDSGNSEVESSDN